MFDLFKVQTRYNFISKTTQIFENTHTHKHHVKSIHLSLKI